MFSGSIKRGSVAWNALNTFLKQSQIYVAAWLFLENELSKLSSSSEKRSAESLLFSITMLSLSNN